MTDTFKALLNAVGRKHWGDVFPDGALPVKSPFEHGARLDDIGFKADVYLVDWTDLSETQRSAILDKLLNKFAGAKREDIESQIRTQGLPIQAKYVETVSIPARFFV